jgi:hypothetical protein
MVDNGAQSRLDYRGELAQLAQFWIERGSQFVAAGLTDQDVKWLRGADLGM